MLIGTALEWMANTNPSSNSSSETMTPEFSGAGFIAFSPFSFSFSLSKLFYFIFFDSFAMFILIFLDRGIPGTSGLKFKLLVLTWFRPI
jgi:hypothetical protein